MFKKILLFLLLLLLISSGFYAYSELDKKRFEISSPMEDLEYKKAIIHSSGNINYKLENLRPLVGPTELKNFIRENDIKPEIYTPSKENTKNGIYRANLHMHTRNSDGQASVKILLDLASEYAKWNLNGQPMYIAITDHNTVLGAKELISTLQKNPQKYNNLKVIAGMEIHSALYNSEYSPKPIHIHLLAWCINPYDKFLNKEFYKKNKKDKINRVIPDRDFEKVINFMSDYSLIGIAHPARYIESTGTKKADYIKDLLQKYKQHNKNDISFVEGYYQVYPYHVTYDEKFEEFLKFINKEAQAQGICRTGSTDVHGFSLFTN